MEQLLPTFNLPSKADKVVFMSALKRFKITEKEMEESFWLAYADPYVPSTGIEFRHIWKHIEVLRKGSSRKSYTYDEMLYDMQKRGITTEAYTMIDETDSKGRKKWVLK